MTTEISTEMMAIELSNPSAIELSEQDLDNISGGLSITQGAGSDFFQRNLTMGQGTFAGPGGSGTMNVMSLEEISSSASQIFNITQ